MYLLESGRTGRAAPFVITTKASLCHCVRKAWPLAFVGLAALTGCSALGPGSAAVDGSKETRTSSAGTPSRTIANFSSELRCMDKLLLDYGTRDLSVSVEDLVDRAKRVDAGATDMLISAVADMTRRSRSIRLVAQRKDAGNSADAGSQAAKRENLVVKPQYVLRGSINKIDNAAQGRNHGRQASINLTLLTTHDRSIVPGVASRQSMVVFPAGQHTDGEVELTKFGVMFKLPIGSKHRQAQASHALVELASIELFGRLAKVPYWTCLGSTANNEAVAIEIQDWFDTMVARPAEIIEYFQAQLRLRRVYTGPIDGAVNPQIKQAVAAYRGALGLSREPKLSLEFFTAYLGANHSQLAQRIQPVLSADSASTTSTPPTAPLTVRVTAANNVRRFARNESVQLTVRPNRNAYVFCFHQDENQHIRRFFPNRFQRDARVDPVKGLQLPGAMRFEIRMNPRGVQETVSCFATERDVLPELASELKVGDFESLSMTSLDQVRNAFVSAAQGVLAQGSLKMLSK